jgi:Galactose oxidase, central domain
MIKPTTASSTAPPRMKFEVTIHHEQGKSNKRNNNMPSRRWGHSLLLYKDFIYLYGGYTNSNFANSNEALYRLDIRDWGNQEWTKILPEEGEVIPAPRDSHSASIIDKKMYIIGGTKSGRLCEDVFFFDFRKQECKL